jgi:hypothetical protein
MEMLMLEEQNKRLLELLRNQSRITPDNNSSGGGRAPSAGTMQPTSRGALTLVPGKKRPTSEDSSWDETKGAWKIAELQTELNRLRGGNTAILTAPATGPVHTDQSTHIPGTWGRLVTVENGRKIFVPGHNSSQGSSVTSHGVSLARQNLQFEFDSQPTLAQSGRFQTGTTQTMPLRGGPNRGGARGPNSRGGSGRGTSPGYPTVDHGSSQGNTNTGTTIHEYQVDISKLIPTILKQVTPSIPALFESYLNSSEASQKRRRLMPAPGSEGASRDGSHTNCVSRKEFDGLSDQIRKLQQQNESLSELYSMLAKKHDKLATDFKISQRSGSTSRPSGGKTSVGNGRSTAPDSLDQTSHTEE